MMHVLALVPGGIGDQILFFPTVESLKQAYPDAKIDIVAEPRSRGAYRVSKYLHDGSLTTIPFDFKDRNGLADWSNFLGILRDREYDAVLSLGRRWTVGALLWLTGIPKRVGFDGSGRWFLTDPVPLKSEQYAAEMYRDLLQGFNLSPAPLSLEISLLKEDLEWAKAERDRQDLPEGYILIHGGSSRLAREKGIDKIYPVEKWTKILHAIREKKPGTAIAVLKGPEDAEWVERLASEVDDLKAIAPPDVGKLAATIAAANLMLCTDSAPMHLSVGLQTYTIALFGPTEPAKLLPTDEKYVAIKSPTGNIADIKPEAIIEKLG